MLFGIASKKEVSKGFEKVKEDYEKCLILIKEIKQEQQQEALKIATLEGAYSVLFNKSQSQGVSVSPQSLSVSKKSQIVSGQGLETKLIQRIKHNKKSLIMAEIMKLLPSYSVIETFNIIVQDKNLCSKASFYRYVDSLKSQKLISNETKMRQR